MKPILAFRLLVAICLPLGVVWGQKCDKPNAPNTIITPLKEIYELYEAIAHTCAPGFRDENGLLAFRNPFRYCMTTGNWSNDAPSCVRK